MGTHDGSCDNEGAWQNLFRCEAESGTESMQLRERFSGRSDQSGSGAETGFLSASQSQIDLDSFAASILLDDDPLDGSTSSLDQAHGLPCGHPSRMYGCSEAAMTLPPHFSPDQDMSSQSLYNGCSSPPQVQAQQQQLSQGLHFNNSFQGPACMDTLLQDAAHDFRPPAVSNDSFAVHRELHRTCSLPPGRYSHELTSQYSDPVTSGELLYSEGSCLDISQIITRKCCSWLCCYTIACVSCW